jgi:hypothetical protein
MKCNHQYSIMALLLALVFSLPVAGADYDLFFYNGIQYIVLSESEHTVETRGPSSLSGHVDIPSTVVYNGETYTVTGIGLFSFSSSGITSMTLPPTIDHIGSTAFGNSKLEEINLPSSLKHIYMFAFSGCKNLKSIVLPEGLLTLGDMAFMYDSSLEEINLPSTLTSLGGECFSGTSIRSLTIPGSVKVIGNDKTIESDSLRLVIVEEGVTSIGRHVFNFCQNADIYLPSTLSYLGEDAISAHNVYFKSPVPPKGSDSWVGWNFIHQEYIPKGTKAHYRYHYFCNPDVLEDESLGSYCDVNININGNGEVTSDDLTQWEVFHYAPAGKDVVLSITPQAKHLISGFTVDGIDKSNRITGGVTLYDDAQYLDFSDEVIEQGKYSIPNLQTAMDVNVAFKKQPFTKLTLRQSECGTIGVRLHRDRPMILKVNPSENSGISAMSLDGNDCLDEVQPDGRFSKVIDDPVTIQVNYQNSGE